MLFGSLSFFSICFWKMTFQGNLGHILSSKCICTHHGAWAPGGPSELLVQCSRKLTIPSRPSMPLPRSLYCFILFCDYWIFFAKLGQSQVKQIFIYYVQLTSKSCMFRTRYCLQMPEYWGTEDHFPTPSPRALTPRITKVAFLTPLRGIVLVIHTARIYPSRVGSQCGDKGALLTLDLFSSTSSFCIKLGFQKNLIKINAAWGTLCGGYIENTS